MSGSPLTPKQGEILEFIELAIRQGRPPSLREIARHFGFSAVGTVQGHVKALEEKGFLRRDKGAFHGLRLEGQVEARHVPILGSAPAGSPLEAIADAQGFLTHSGRGAGELFALKVRGESMKDEGIRDGDFVIVRKQSRAENGEIVVAELDGEATIKYLENKKGRLRLLPANSEFQPIDIEGRELRIVGRVVGVQRFY